MATTVSITRSHLFAAGGDVDGDNVADPGDSIITTIRIQNLTAFDALNLTVTDTLLGSTLVAGSVKITPIAFDDSYTGVTGNTPITYGSLQGVLANDVDPDGAGGNAGLSVVSINGVAIGGNIAVTGGTVNMSANGGFTYTPTTGFNGVATFNYTIVDAQNLNNVTTGVVTINVNGGMIWYVDNAYAGENGASDGSYLKPFTNFNSLNDNGTGAGGTPGTADGIVGDDDVDGAGSTIFVYHNSATHYATGIALEAGQSLIGDGNALLVNGHNIGGTERTGGVDNVATNAIIDHATYGVQLATDNIVKGVDLVGTTANAIGISDGNGSVTTGANTALVSNVAISGQGQIVDIDQGGKIDITLNSAASTSNANGAGNGAIDLNTVQGSFTVTGATTIDASAAAQTGGGIDITNASGSLASTFQGNVTINSAATNAINFQNNSTGTSTLTLSGSSKNIDTTSGTALNIDTNTGATVSITGGGLDIDTTAGGKGLNLVSTAFELTGTVNTIDVASAQIMTVANATVTGGVTFQSLTATGNSPGVAIDINNLDGNAFTVTNGTTIANTVGATMDAINIRGGSSTNFAFQGTTDINNATGDGVELNGANGTVTFSDLQVDTVAGIGLSIINATNTVTVTTGAIGASNDPTGDAVNISGGTGAVAIGATISKTTAGNIVDISGHSGGQIDITGTLSSTLQGSGIALANNGGGIINFTHSGTVINTSASASAAIAMSNNAATGATVNFTGGTLAITTGSGAGITATSTTVGAGTINITGSGNTIVSGAGAAINIANTNIGSNDITFQSVSAGTGVGSAGVGISLDNTGSNGGLHITGTGSAGSGGTIQHKTGVDNSNTAGIGIYLNNTYDVQLNRMQLNDFDNFAIRGNNVTNFTLADSTINGISGNVTSAADEAAIRFDGLLGVASITNSNLQGGWEYIVKVLNSSGTLDRFTVANTTIGNNHDSNTGNGGDGFQVVASGTATVNVSVTNSIFQGAGANVVNFSAQNSANMDVVFRNNNISNNHANQAGATSNLLVFSTSTGNVTYDIQNNTITADTVSAIHNTSNGIAVAKGVPDTGSGGTMSGIINANTIGNPAVAESGSAFTGLFVSSLGSGTHTTLITNNNIYRFAEEGILLKANDPLTGGNSVLNATLLNNDTLNPDSIPGGNAAFAGIWVLAGSGSGTETNTINLVLGDANNATNKNDFSTGDPAGFSDVEIQELGSGSVINLSKAGSVAATVAGVVQADNNNGASTSVDSTGTINLVTAATYRVIATPATAYEDGSTNIVYTFLRYGDTSAAATINFTVGGTATFGTDYTQSGAASFTTSAGSVTFAAGSATATVTLDPTVDASVESNETIILTITSAGASNPTSATAKILDDDTPPMLLAPGGGSDQTSAQGGEHKDPVTDGTGNPPVPPGDGGTPPPPPPPPPVVVDDGIVSQSELNLIVDAAIQRWADAGASAEQLAAMRGVSVSVSDMMGVYLGSSRLGQIRIDSDGGGFGWFVDSTPGDDSEYEGTGSRLTADSGSAAEHHVDLLTVVMHELGHQIGLEDSYRRADSADLMFGYLNLSERRLPVAGDADGAVPGPMGQEEYALGPIAVTGTLPGNKAVDIIFTSIVNNFSNQVIPVFNNTSTVEDSAAVDSFPSVTSAIDPLIVDTVSISSTIFIDANRNGVFDAGEGVSGVALTLYADANGNGVLDGAELTNIIATTTSGALGAYTFASLAEGNYVVSVNASNFNSGQPLFGTYNVTGVPNDPDDNVDNDDNGLNGPSSTVITNPITLNYNAETQSDGGAIPKNDVNNTLDIGFVANVAPDAVDDSVSVAEDSGANDLTSQLLTNDTDADGDTRTITSATQGAHGTTSVVAGVLTYTPAGNYNGTDTFQYTISDGNGHTDTATVNVTVTAVNDPVTGTAPPTATVNEDSVNAAITGLSISDVDATLAPAGVYEVTLSATHGTLTLTTLTGLTFTGGSDGTGDTTMTFHGTLADINTALATAKYSPDSNYNGSAQIGLQVTDTFGGIVATGTGVATNDSDNIAVTVTSVNDAPAGTDDSANAVEGSTYTFLTSDFSDGFSDPIDTPPNNFAGVKITTLPSAAAGVIKLNGTAINAGDIITKAQLDGGQLTFVPAAGSAGTSPTFTFQVQDDGGILNGGVDLDQSANTFTINIAANNIVPALDLDANDSVTVGTGYSGAYTEGGAAAPISDTDVSITDADAGDDIVSAIITITNPETGDKLNVGALPAGITIDGTSTDTMVKLVGPPGTSKADFETAIEAITYSSTSDNPTDGGTNLSRAITVVVNDGQGNSNTATANIAVTGINDGPANSLGGTIGTGEDAIQAWLSGMSVSDPDSGGNDIRVTLNVGHGILDIVTNAAGGLTAGDISGNGTGTVVLTGTQAEINATLAASNGVTYTPTTNYNGADTLTVTTNDLGATGTDPGLTGDGTSEQTVSTRTITISASNDAPVVINGGTASATATDEDTPGAGETVSSLFSGHYSDQADAQSSVSNPTGSSPGSFGGIAVTAVSSTAEGHWQYLDTNTSTWTNIDPVSDSSALLIGAGTQIRFNPAPNYNGPAPTLTAHLIDNSLGFGITFGQHADLSGVGATGGQTAYSTGTVVLSETVNAVNDPPSGTSSTISATEDTARPFTTGDFGFTDTADSGDTLSAVTITGVTGGKIFYDADGAGGADPVEATLPATYTAADINAGKLTFVPTLNLNGTGAGSVTFQVIDSSGAGNNIDPSANTLTIDIAAVNDQPNIPNSPTITVDEQVATIINPAITVSDADLDARNGGSGDYGGASFAINRAVANAQDVFSFAGGGLFTVSGNNLQAGGQTFATFTQSGGILNISFTSSGTAATTALVNDVLQHLQYTNTSDTPPASVTLLYVIDDGAPGAGQGTVSGGNNIDGGQVVINITDTGEGPALDLNGAGAGTSATLAYTENQTAQLITPAATVSDIDSPNFNTGVLTLAFTANGSADDRLEVIDQGFGQGKIFVSGNDIYYDFGTGVDGMGDPILDPRIIGTFTGGTSGSDPLAIALTSDATVAVTQLLLRDIGYYNVSDAPVTAARTVTYTLTDGTGNTSNSATATINVTAVPDTSVANDDNFFTDDNVPVGGNVFDEHGNGNDYDPEGNPLTVTAVNGSAGNVGNQITLASGAKLTLNSDGTFTYDPNGKFNSLVPVDSGAVNVFAIDSFTYTLNGTDTATVSIGLSGIISPGDIYKGDSDDNVITGTPADDFFLVNQGGNDNLSGLGGNDLFLFGATLTSADMVNGGAGNDQIAIQGNYPALTLGSGVVSVESLAIMPGSDTRFGDPGTNFYDYNITTVDANVAAGALMVVDANRLRVGEDFTFNGSAESDGSFFIYGGNGVDTLTGGAKNDVFYFGENGQWGSSDTANGGPAGTDQLALRGDYTIVFGAGQLVSIESIGLVSALDTRFGALGTRYDYNLTMNDGNVAAGQRMTVDGAPLAADETLTFNGSAETNGSFRVFGGAGADTITGSQGGDILSGGRGADSLTGAGGNDTYLYRSVLESTAASKDTINDFNTGDKIDLSAIDAILGGGTSNDAFSFIGANAFHNVAGELRATNVGGTWTVQGDVNGDGVADFELTVVVTDAHPLAGGDFVL